MLRRCLLPLVSFVVIASAAAQARAATLTVNTTADSASPGPGLCSLREAVQATDAPGSTAGGCAPAAFGANTIVLGQGTYDLQAPNGELKVTPQVTSLTITGAGEGDTVINAAGLGDRILEVQAGASVTIRDLTLTGGEAPAGASGTSSPAGEAPGQAGGNGGAILNAGSLTLTDAAISSNGSGSGGTGGGPPLFGIDTPGLTGGAGGAGGQGGAIFNSGNLMLTGVTIADNRAGAGGNGGQGEQVGGSGGAAGVPGAGGGIANVDGNVTITDSTIRGNTAGSGGAGGMGGSYFNSEPSVGGNGANGAAGAGGGGVWSDGGELVVTNSTFVSNIAGDGGAGGAGGIGGGAGANGANGGSGGAIAATSATSSKLLNVTVVDNGPGAGGASGAGGSGGGPAGIAGVSGDGGGIGGDGSAAVHVQNSLLALNPGGNCEPGAVLDAGHNLSFGDATCPSTFGSGDPKLGPLQDNGGPTQTIGLRAGSAAIDQVPASGAGCPATDQRGVTRPSGPACDIGAYEVAPPMVLKAGLIQVTGHRAVRISAAITPNAGRAQVWVLYGRKKPYGKRSRGITAGGVTPTTVSVRLSGLDLGAIYHYRIVVASTDGATQTAELKLAVPVLSALHLVPAVFREGGKRGPRTVLSYTEVRAATTTFAVQRREGRKWVTIGRFPHHDVRGRNRVRWGGRVHGRRLRRGRYRLLATPRAGSATGATVSAGFRIT